MHSPNLRRARIGSNHVVESGRAIAPPAAHGVRAVVEKPAQGLSVNRLAGCEDDGEMPIPIRIHIGAVGHQQFHHRNAVAQQRGPHQRPVAALVHVGAVVDHPLRHGQARWAGRFPRDSALRHPGQGTVVPITQWSAVQRWVSRHQALDAFQVVSVDSLLQTADFIYRFHVSLEFSPACKAIRECDAELCIGVWLHHYPRLRLPRWPPI
jgi:hypothetical protein